VKADLNGWFDQNAKSSAMDANGKLLRGVRANGEIVSFPSKAVLSRKSAAGREELQGLDDEAALAVYLVLEKFGGASSEFSDYVKSLPTELDLPMFWSREELSAMEGTSVTEKLEQITENIKLEYGEVVKSLDENIRDVVTYDRYAWAQGIVFSRSFDLGSSLGPVLVPVVDSIPPSPEGNCSVRTARGGLFGAESRVALAAERDLKADASLSLSRPAESNAQFLIEYGRVFPDRPELNVVEFVFGVSSMDPFCDDKLDILEYANNKESIVFSVDASEKSQQALLDIMQFLRLVCIEAQDAFLLEAIFRDQVWGFMEMPVSKENERRVCETVIASCEAALEDMSAAADGGEASRRAGLARDIVEGERQVYRKVINFFEGELKQLDGKEYYQERRLKDLDLLRPVDPSEVVETDSTGRSSRAFDEYY